MEVGLLTAFLGGALALLSPCGALLLPAFFASTVGAGPRLWAHGGVFLTGLLVVLVPLGVGAGALGTLFVTRRDLVIAVAAVLLVVLGVVQLLGLGVDLARVVPGVRAVQRSSATRTGWAKTFLLGAAGGVAGFCAGPILGAVLTLAAAQGDVVGAGLLLAVYGVGMVLPLLVLATLWGRLDDRRRAALRGRTVTVLGRELHTTSIVTGLLLVAAGVLFWATNGLVGMPELVPVSTQAWLQGQGALLANPVLDVGLLLAVAAVVVVVWTRHRARRERAAAAETEEASR
ncbi:cytochrome c biogenesis CcdA family protein [Isoptericola sp. 178]|uniref:cytochrome c biogenesis CcdA family protein n=1 Tax=Isoptericola sp. 178 TaxID=3064651 RepID=UPI002713B917|nr:cytochrome c biogenesis protein CcdA [Isoptericola sp. 178]MDO8145431.1 cytochrome c biogenesis protein CcdA [Isoptericola sp. 178]